MENRARAKFCSECAAPLREQSRIQSLAFTSDFGPRPLNSLPKTQTPTPIQYTPNHLAERILAEQAAMETRGAVEGARKTITALFADIKNQQAQN
jgi:hypothetical protein